MKEPEGRGYMKEYPYIYPAEVGDAALIVRFDRMGKCRLGKVTRVDQDGRVTQVKTLKGRTILNRKIARGEGTVMLGPHQQVNVDDLLENAPEVFDFRSKDVLGIPRYMKELCGPYMKNVTETITKKE